MKTNDQINHLFASTVVMAARAQSFQEALERILPSKMDGVSPRQWLYDNFQKHLQKSLISLEDKNPEVAAEIQRIVSEVYKIDP